MDAATALRELRRIALEGVEYRYPEGWERREWQAHIHFQANMVEEELERKR